MPLRRVAGIVGNERNLVKVVGLRPLDARVLLEGIRNHLRVLAGDAIEEAYEVGVAGHHALVRDRLPRERRDAIELARAEGEIQGGRLLESGVAVLDDQAVEQRLGRAALRLHARSLRRFGTRRAVGVEDLLVEAQPVDGFLRLEERQRGLERDAIGAIARPPDLDDARAQCLDDQEPMPFRQGGLSGERCVAAELDDDRVDLRRERRCGDQCRDDEQESGERAARP